jgi:hypothetical protein
MRPPCALTICGLAVVAACSGPGPGGDGPTDRAGLPTVPALDSSHDSLDCNAVGHKLPSEDRVVVLGNVALPDPTVTPALEAIRQPGATSPLQTFYAKDGLGFRAGSQWRIRVPQESQDHLRIGWGSPATPGTVIRPPTGCHIPPDAEWLWYPGGYWTDGPGCYSVVVEVGEQEERVDVGIGKSCPDQDSPPSPANR